MKTKFLLPLACLFVCVFLSNSSLYAGDTPGQKVDRVIKKTEDKVHDAKNKIKDKAHDVKNQVADKAHDAKNKIKDQAQDVKNKAKEAQAEREAREKS